MLSNELLYEIRGLQRACEANEPIQLKLNWDMLQTRNENEVNDFFHYEEGNLVGFLGLYGFGNQVEVCGMVAPEFRRDGIFSTLFYEALKIIEERKYTTILLNAPSESISAKGFLNSISCTYAFSEYQMKWQETALVVDEGVMIRDATPCDLEIEIQLDVECFGDTEEEARDFNNRVKQEDFTHFFMIETDGKTVGKMRLSYANGEAWIFGFAVFPGYQGKGIGRKALTKVVSLAHQHGKPIFLEVEAQNVHALGLYESCGFRTFHSQDYYEYHA